MSVRDFLEQARHLDDAINSQVAELTHLRNLSLKISSSCLEEHVSHSASREAPFAKWVERIVDKEREINDAIDKLVAVKLEISDYIGTVDNVEWQCLLRNRYVLCRRWSDVAAVMGCSVSTVKRLHKKILKNLEN